MQPPPHQESTTRQQQQRDHSNTSTTSRPASALASPARNRLADSYGDTELSSTGTNFRVASLAAPSEQQSTNQHPLHTRLASHGHNNNLRTTASSNGNSTSKSSTDRATIGSANAAAAPMGMGDGIINQSMKEDLDNWITALGLTPGLPVHVVGFFGHCRDLSMFERVTPAVRRKDGTYETSSCIGSFEDDERMPVYYDGCRDTAENQPKQEQGPRVHNGGWTLGLGDQKTTGDIHLFVDRAKNTLMLQHAYLFDTQEMLSACQESADAVTKDKTSLMKWMHDQEYESHRALLFLFLVSHVAVLTSPDMNLDPRMISILSALSTIKRQMLQELDRFMAICWDRIGVPPPDHERSQSDNGGGGRGSNPLANILTPGRCVPVLIFVIERVPIIAPWHEAGASENQIVEQLKNHLLKKSVDAMQTRLRYLFRACRLVQSMDSSAGAFDGRQLFVLPSPSSTPFVHVIPHFIGKLELPEVLLDYSEDSGNETLDPAAAVLRQRLMTTTGGSQSSKKQGSNAKSQPNKSHREKAAARPTADEGNRALGNPTLREIYDAVVQARDQPLSGTTGAGGRSAAEGASQLSLGSLYLDYSGPLLRQFVDGWLKSVTNPGGYGNIIGRRHIGAVEVPSSQQWLAGYLGVCEALGITSINSPGINKSTHKKNGAAPSQMQDDTSTDESISNRLQNASIAGGGINGNSHGNGGAGGEAVRERGPRRGGKKYSLRCAHLVQKKIQDFVQTDEVMEEL
ncbi:hypothetical protein EC957_007649 [Mortierella hygrophila]|uniref:Nonsense-mediated mRNA decay factor SMG8 n=1 Tax=Mortierella hygrophila TaxID=979708 RepID=A0A9P6EXT4_9FUNG|nr:hypothetical protein EC957_007649 [Mortierella hygrophila]